MERPDSPLQEGGNGNPPAKKLAFQASPPAGLPPGQRALVQKFQRNFRFFRNLREDEILLFLRMCKSKSFEAGEAIAPPGENADCLCLLVNGEIIFQAGNGEPFRAEPGAVLGAVPLAKGGAVAGGRALLFFASRALLNKHMPSLMAEQEVCPLGVRSKERGQLCFDCKAGKFFQPLPEVLRSFCKRASGFRACAYYRAFLEAAS